MKRIGYVLVLVLAASRAEASPPCAVTDHPWVALVVQDDGDATFAARVANELDAELREQAIDLCAGTREGTPIARVEVAPVDRRIAIRLELRDAVTAKEVARTIDVSTIPPDGRARAVALAIDELLRASWAELALRTAPPTAGVPPSVSHVVADSLGTAKPPPPARPFFGLAIAGSMEAFSAGQVRFGSDARASFRVAPRVELALRFGFRRALTASAPDGTIDAESFLGGPTAFVYFLAPDGPWGLDAFARADVARISFHGNALSGAGGASRTATSIELAAGARLRRTLVGTLSLALELGAGVSPLAASARDGGVEISGTGGAAFVTSLTLGGGFR